MTKARVKPMIPACTSGSVSASGSISAHTSTDHLPGAAHAEGSEAACPAGRSAHAEGSLSHGAGCHETDARDAADAAYPEEEIEVTSEMMK
jgi:hypothetical protein